MPQQNIFKSSVINSETANLSRQGEDVCGFGTHLQCRAATWKQGQLSPLHLLAGGKNSYALDMNHLGQVVGFFDTDEYDPNCAAATTVGFQFQVVIWDRNGKARQLAPLNGDSVAFACRRLYPSPGHAVLWERIGTTPIDLGSSAGGPAGASAINDRGDVSGNFFTSAGFEPFFWTPERRKAVPLVPPTGFVAALNPCCKTKGREIVGLMFDCRNTFSGGESLSEAFLHAPPQAQLTRSWENPRRPTDF